MFENKCISFQQKINIHAYDSQRSLFLSALMYQCTFKGVPIQGSFWRYSAKHATEMYDWLSRSWIYAFLSALCTFCLCVLKHQLHVAWTAARKERICGVVLDVVTPLQRGKVFYATLLMILFLR